MIRKFYRLKNGVQLISVRSEFGASAAIWLTWASSPMQMPRGQVAAWLRTAKREHYIAKETS